MIYLIALQKQNPIANYSAFEEEVKKTGAWWHHMEGIWIVRTKEQIQLLHERLISKIYSEDRLLIIQVSKNFQGWLPQDAWEWLNAQFKLDMRLFP